MANKEESSFLKGVESCLDSLFGEDTKPIKESDLDTFQTVSEKVADDLNTGDFRETQIIKVASRETEISSGEQDGQDQSPFVRDAAAGIDEDMREIPPLDETNIQSAVSSEPVKVQDNSVFISEIEKRFSAIFGDDDKNSRAVEKTEDTVGQEENKGFDQAMEDISLPSSAVLQSHLKDLKSIVLSLEWEINDQILEQFEGEVNKLHLFYTGDRIIQGLLRILRFVGRYVRVRGANANQESINLLMSVYDHLEGVTVSEGMPEANKQIFLIESIKQYQSWVEKADIENPVETEAPEAPVDEMKPLVMERPEDEFRDEQKVEEKPFAEPEIDKPAGDELSLRGEDQIELVVKEQESPVEVQPTETYADEVKPLEMERSEDSIHVEQKEAAADIRVAEGRPFDGAGIDKPFGDELSVREVSGEDQIEWDSKEQDSPVQTQPAPLDKMLPPSHSEDVEKLIAAMKDLPPHEAFAYALDELKKTFQTEIDALKEEIRHLKNTG